MAKAPTERSRIDVIVRKRPLSDLEKARGDTDVVLCNNTTAIIEELKLRIDGSTYIDRYEFRVDRFYDEHADNQLIYEEYVKPLVEFAFKEQKTCSCFTYGQTGSGKTFTMIGSRKLKNPNMPYMRKYLSGIYEYAANDIYRMLCEPEYDGRLEVMISFYEIYCGKLYDLLQDRYVIIWRIDMKMVEALDNGKREVIIKDLTLRRVTCKEDLIGHMLGGLTLRKIGQNSQNDQSSRSHALLRIELREIETMKNCGRIAFIDLAGSERGADCINQPKQTQMDGAGINRSLLALKECIRAMDLDKTHIPFRDSELTKVLRDIFVGGSRNLMIANICPSNVSCEQTLNTLRYASRVKNFRQPQTTGSNGAAETEHESSNVYRKHLSIPTYESSRLRSDASEYASGPSLAVSPRLKNMGLIGSKLMSTSQKLNKSRTLAPPMSSRSAVSRKISDITSPRETIRSAREANAQPYSRSRGSNLPDPFSSVLQSMKSQQRTTPSVETMLEDITLDPLNQNLYENICDSLELNASNSTSSVDADTKMKIEKSIDALQKAERIYNHIALQMMTVNGDPEIPNYAEFIKSKIKMQVKPLLFLKQAVEEHNNLMRVNSSIPGMDP
ncbi:kinesin-like protein, putative [Babesia bigemina]|uniref:Kinesin-like protein n=1 Tax=Babesia bigemina TaxID=5866 RepID=A0A061CZT3_BABBI|nr:LOW QUALITY PROTEIN: kinesin-like protein, putative [Babesia bigemina]CDR93923.1 kinesin-like protein, putative [Babesia bigemina]|eukprot:XP_012766109.1 LOW QUALITY PROTEIN: kinesin-like protein, putative [Babesia bigemina]